MTIAQALARLNALKPHEYPDDAVIAWLADVEQLIINEVIAWHWPRWWPCRKPKPPGEDPLDQNAPGMGDAQTGDTPSEDAPGEDTPDAGEPPKDERPKWPPERYTTATPGDTVLIVPDPYSELYVHYLMAQIDYHNAEMARYTNSMSMFGASLSEFSNWYNRTHLPIQRAYVRI